MPDKPILIFDHDGTLADVTVRRQLAELAHEQAERNGQEHPKSAFWKTWQNPDNIEYDQPSYVANFLQSLWLTDQYHVIIFSARTAKLRPETEEWLYKHGIPYNELYMRPVDDYRADATFKKELFDAMSEEKKNRVEIIFDDRQQVVDLWRSLSREYDFKVVQVINPKHATF